MKRASVALLFVVLAGCDHDKGAPAPPSSGKPEPAMAPSAPAARSAEAPSAWYAGAWTGTYQATKHHIDLSSKVGGLPEWAVDDARGGTGEGTLRLAPDATGAATGTVEGPLGPAALEGAFDGDTLAVRFFPKNDDRSGFSGVLVARRDGDRLTGTLDAATADGRAARTAKVALQRAP